MHSAAERARLRRQKEEEERENQKERARKKAAELAISAEAKAKEERERREKEEEERKRLEEEKRAEARREEEKRVAQQKEREAEELLRQVEKESMEQPKVQVPPSPARNRTHPPTAPRALLKPTNPSQSDASQSHPSAKVDSWRSKAAPLPPIQPPPPPSALPKPSTLPSHELESLSLPPGDDLEVVDFSDLGKLVGEESPTTLVPPPTSAPPAPSLTSPTVGPSSRRPPRPHASDFFEVPVDGAALAPSSDQHTAAKSETSSWRKPTEVAGSSLEVNVTVANAAESTSLVPHTASEAPVTPKVSPPLASIPRRSTLSSADQPQFRMSGMPSPTQPKHPYKEAPMSALTDTLSRIKGALHGMQSSQDSTSRAEGLNPLSPSAIAFPRARANGSHSKQSSLLDFSFDHPQLTQLARPTTPPPNLTVIRLPRKSRPQTVVGTRQLHFWKLPPRAPRMDILTWDPPIKDLNRRTWSRDEMFFPPEKSLVVRLPGSTSSSRSEGTSTLPPDRKLPGPTPRVQLPSARGHDRSASAATAQLPSPPNSDFNPTSRSPPPELPASTTKSHTSSRSASVSLPANSTEVRSSTPTTAPQRSKPQPKMPAGTDLAFYRPRSSGNVEQEVASPSVMFTVTSELDDPAESGSSKTNNVVSSSDSNPSGSEETVRFLRNISLTIANPIVHFLAFTGHRVDCTDSSTNAWNNHNMGQVPFGLPSYGFTFACRRTKLRTY
jgi:serine/arginine repetitive matrix protein 2